MLNGHQVKLLEALRANHDADAAYGQLRKVKPQAYSTQSFRELLHALDALNVMTKTRWSDLMCNGLVEHSGWIESGRLAPAAFSEIGTYHETYGRGETSIRLIIDLIEFSDSRPANAMSFARRTVREYFNGLQPLTERAAFLVKRYFEMSKPLTDENVLLMMRIADICKGLDNHSSFDFYYCDTLIDALGDAKNPDDRRVNAVISTLESYDEHTSAEIRLMETMRERGFALPNELLSRLERGVEMLSGLG